MRNGPSVRVLALSAAALLSFSLCACNTYRDQLVRAQQSFEQNQHDRTLGLLRELEADATRLSREEQAQYAYIRGMTDYRIGHRSDARHWLSIARAHDEATPGVLPADWKARMTESLDELNNVVYVEGMPALAVKKTETSVTK